MKRINLIIMAVIALTLGFTACTSVQNSGYYYDGSNNSGSDLTAGKVERTIKKGMSGAEVITALGEPNTITIDENGLKTWVWDKIATEANYTKSNDVLFLIIYAQQNRSSNYQVTQKTLTVIIKLRDDKVESFTYHQSKF